MAYHNKLFFSEQVHTRAFMLEHMNRIILLFQTAKIVDIYYIVCVCVRVYVRVFSLKVVKRNKAHCKDSNPFFIWFTTH